MRRRDFIEGLAASVAWPLAAHAQQPSMPVIGFLNSASADAYTRFLESFRRGLGEVGFVEGDSETAPDGSVNVECDHRFHHL